MAAPLRFLRAFAAGLLAGLVLGLVDTYGYATTGYTTAEVSVLVAPVLVRLLMGRRPALIEVVVGTVVAYGVSFSTLISSGMLITFAFTRRVYDRLFGGNDFPPWLFGPNPPDFVPTYLLCGALSVSGAVLAYTYRHLLLDKLRLPYPMAIASYIVAGLVSKVSRHKHVVALVALGLALQLPALILGGPRVDLTPTLSQLLRGSVMALSLDFTLLFLSIVLPPRASLSVAIGSLLNSLLLLPLGVSLRFFEPALEPTIEGVLEQGSWYIACVIFGAVAAVAVGYSLKMRHALKVIVQAAVRESRSGLPLLMLLGFASLYVAASLRMGAQPPWQMAAALLWVLAFLPLLAILTTLAVGETGIAAQALYPFNTVYLYLLGFRGFAPYIFMDHYLGIPMPASMAYASANVLKLARAAAVAADTLLLTFVTSFLIGLGVTMLYGLAMIHLVGLGTRVELLRWLPYALWSIRVFRGELDLSVVLPGSAVGLAFAAAVMVVSWATPWGVSLLPLVIGLSLPPDYGLLFLAGAFIRWFVSQYGLVAEEKLLIYATALLVGSGLAIPLYVALSALGCFGA